jgi:uncharacterized protein
MSLALRALVPLRTPADGRQASASARDSFGAIGMSVSGDPVVVAELLVHEFQHEKLGALLDLVELCPPGGPERYHAPWRPEPRSASALAQGTYAFTGVAGFWRERRSRLTGAPARRAAFQFAYWRAQVRFALDQLLHSGELTDDGVRFFTELRQTVLGWHDDVVAPGAAEAARLSTLASRVAWRLANHRADPDDVAALAAAWAAGRPPSLVAEPSIGSGPAVDSEPAGPSLLPELLEEAWVTGTAHTGGAAMILNGEYRQATELLGAMLADREDTSDRILLAAGLVGAQDSGAFVACARPELIREVAALLRRTGRAPHAVALARWLGGLPSVVRS